MKALHLTHLKVGEVFAMEKELGVETRLPSAPRTDVVSFASFVT
jgi:hypothetical protein